MLFLQVSNGDLAEAVAFLTEKNAKVPQQDETTYYQTSQVASDRYISVGSQADTSEQLHSTFLNCYSFSTSTVDLVCPPHMHTFTSALV